jgi:phosphorylase kinase alpha/beta subunit
VHYVSHTYCTPDFGIWERGNKINHGTAEINGSSVGMAKAALEAMDGFNLFGDTDSQEAVIYVVPSDVARSRATLQGLLPRESNSKETDAALLSVIGYPAYAIEDDALVERTRNKIVKKLAGNYGCKRFLLDGHQSSIEDSTRLHYEPSELREFEHIESEWPLFFTYLLLDALMRNDSEAIEHWKKKIEPLFVEQDGDQLLPELYIVTKETIAAEKANPGSQKRVANENIPLVWAQSLYMLSDMILDGVLTPADIDPLNRRDYVANTFNAKPLVPILAENEVVKAKLLELGFESETIEEVKPLEIRHASMLSDIHTRMGANDKLELTGRPHLVARTISTSRVHVVSGEKFIFLPYYFNPQGFYFSYDNTLLVDHFRATLRFLATQWSKLDQPIVPLLIRVGMLSDENKEAMVELLNEIKNGISDSVAVETGAMHDLMRQADQLSIDNVKGLDMSAYKISPTRQEDFLQEDRPQKSNPLTVEEVQNVEMKNNDELITLLDSQERNALKVHVLNVLLKRHKKEHVIRLNDGEFSLTEVAEKIYKSATVNHEWDVIRRIADTTGRYDDRLEDVLLDIVIRQKRLAVGRSYSEKATFSKPSESWVIVETIDQFSGNNTAESTLTQEMILHLGYLIRSEPELFDNILTLRPWYFIQLLVGQISRDSKIPIGDAYEQLLCLSPSTIYNRLRKVMKSFTTEVQSLLNQENISASTASLTASTADTHQEINGEKDWAQWREERGVVGLLSGTFYKNLWYLLRQCNALVIGDKFNIKNRMGSELTHDSTAGERNFELIIDRMLQRIPAPEYRQLNIEAIESMAWLFKQNPEFRVNDDLILDALIGHAVRINWEKSNPDGNYDEQRGNAWDNFYQLSTSQADESFVEAFMYLLAVGGFDE